MKRLFLSLLMMTIAAPGWTMQNTPATPPQQPPVSALEPVSLASPSVQRDSGPTMKDLFAGKIAPPVIKLKDMNSGWRRFNITTSQGNLMNMMMPMVGRGTDYFTKGDTVNLNGTAYLIAYTLPYEKNRGRNDFFVSNNPSIVAVTPDTELHLCILNLRSDYSILNISPFDMSKELLTNEETLNARSFDNLKQLNLAFQMYIQDHDEVMPPMKSYSLFKQDLYPYLKNDSVFYMPGTHTPYALNSVLNLHKLKTIAQPANMIVLYEPYPRNDGSRAVSFLDGRETVLTPAEWDKAKKACKI